MKIENYKSKSGNGVGKVENEILHPERQNYEIENRSLEIKVKGKKVKSELQIQNENLAFENQ